MGTERFEIFDDEDDEDDGGPGAAEFTDRTMLDLEAVERKFQTGQATEAELKVAKLEAAERLRARQEQLETDYDQSKAIKVLRNNVSYLKDRSDEQEQRDEGQDKRIEVVEARAQKHATIIEGYTDEQGDVHAGLAARMKAVEEDVAKFKALMWKLVTSGGGIITGGAAFGDDIIGLFGG